MYLPVFFFLCAVTLLFNLPAGVQAQSSSLALGISPDAGLGWWVYNKGLDSTHLGYDRTSLSAFTHLKAQVLLPTKGSWSLRTSLGFRAFHDKDMTRSDSPRGNVLEYDISDGGPVRFYQLGIGAEYSFIPRQSIQIFPYWEGGLFLMESRHPQRSNFGLKTWWESGVMFLFSLRKQMDLVLGPRFARLTIRSKTPLYPGEIHQIHSLSLSLGLRFHLFKAAHE